MGSTSLTSNAIEFNIEPRSIDDSMVQTVRARELHSFLGVGKDFSNWIKDRIEQYGFIEGGDFVVFANSGENPRGGRPTKEYAISLDMAKELAMVERNERGKQARQYFIECERRAKAASAPVDVRDPAQLANIAIQLIEVNKELQGKVEEMRPQVEALERIALSDGSMCPTDAAKTLQIRRKDLLDFFQARRWAYRRPGCTGWIAYQDKLASGLLEHKVTTFTGPDGYEKSSTQLRVTPKGLTRLAKEFSRSVQVA